MNVENLSKLIEHLRALPDEKFDMGAWDHPCGSPACIAGHASVLFAPDRWRQWVVAAKAIRKDEFDSEDARPAYQNHHPAIVGRDVLGLTYQQAVDLFFPTGNYWQLPDGSEPNYSRAKAISILERLRDDGRAEAAAILEPLREGGLA